jgi:hypothetical protein
MVMLGVGLDEIFTVVARGIDKIFTGVRKEGAVEIFCYS